MNNNDAIVFWYKQVGSVVTDKTEIAKSLDKNQDVITKSTDVSKIMK